MNNNISPKPKTGSGAFIVAAIGLIASCIGIFAFVTGLETLPDIITPATAQPSGYSEYATSIPQPTQPVRNPTTQIINTPTETSSLTYESSPTHTPRPQPTTVNTQPPRRLDPVALPFQDNFDSGIDTQWRILSGQPIVTNGYLGAATDQQLTLEVGNDTLQNYTVRFDYKDARNGVWLGGIAMTVAERIRFETQGYPRWQTFQDNQWIDLTEFTAQIGLPGNLRFVVNGNNYRVYVNGTLFSEVTYGVPLSGPFSITVQRDTFIDNFSMTNP